MSSTTSSSLKDFFLKNSQSSPEFNAFKEHLKREYSGENLEFWKSINNYKNKDNMKELIGLFDSVYKSFFLDSRFELNISGKHKENIDNTLKCIFDDTYEKIKFLLEPNAIEFAIKQGYAEYNKEYHRFIDDIVANSFFPGYQKFKEFLQEKCCEEYFEYLEKIYEYKESVENTNASDMIKKFDELYQIFIQIGSSYELNFDSDDIVQITDTVRNIFNDTLDDIYDLMNTDSFPRFMKATKKTIY